MGDSSTQAETSEPPTGRSHGATPLWLIWALFFMVIVYPLSIGPAAKIHEKHPKARPAIEAVYKPVTTLVEHSSPVRDFFIAYLHKIWKFPPPPPQAPPASPQTNSAAASGK